MTQLMEEKKNELEGIPENKQLMTVFINETPKLPQESELVTGVVAAKDKGRVYVDLGIFGTGVIYGREYLAARDIIKKTKVGEEVTAKIVCLENEDGYIELSLREAKEASLWNDAEEALKKKEVLELSIKDSNKGGLILEWRGLSGFLPASQLSQEHYPRVEDGDKDQIAQELAKLVGEKIKVSIITADADEDKLIFSEKNPGSPERQKIIAQFAVGDVITGEVTGAVEFGIFVKLEEGLEGLVHISEMDWALVENPKEKFKIGEQVKAKIIEIKDDKISLSIKALRENPWKKVIGKYKGGDMVQGVVIKYNKYGALISIEEGVAGLIHISEFADEQELHNKLELGKTYGFEITLFEPEEQRMTLRLPKEKEEEKD